MARSIYQLQRELEYAQARQTYRQNYRPDVNAQRDPRPKSKYAYYSLLVKIGAVQAVYKIDASNNAVNFFGVANLGLDNTSAELQTALAKPKSLKPSLVKAAVGDPSPVRVRAYGGTGRPYWRYNRNAEGTAQAFYSAPICTRSATPALSDLDAKLTAIATAQGAALGTSGRLYLISERTSASGI